VGNVNFMLTCGVIRHDLKMLGLVEDMAHNRKLWKARIKVTDS